MTAYNYNKTAKSLFLHHSVCPHRGSLFRVPVHPVSCSIIVDTASKKPSTMLDAYTSTIHLFHATYNIIMLNAESSNRLQQIINEVTKGPRYHRTMQKEVTRGPSITGPCRKMSFCILSDVLQSWNSLYTRPLDYKYSLNGDIPLFLLFHRVHHFHWRCED